MNLYGDWQIKEEKWPFCSNTCWLDGASQIRIFPIIRRKYVYSTIINHTATTGIVHQRTYGRPLRFLHARTIFPAAG